MSPIVCRYCTTNLATSSRWYANWKIDVCDECALYLATDPDARRSLVEALDDAARDVEDAK